MRKLFILVFLLGTFLPTPISATQSPLVKIRIAEATIQGLPTEHAILFNANGDILARYDNGTADDVRIDTSVCQGCIMTHNHTLNVSFSTADVENAVRMKLSQVRVVEPDITCVLTATSQHPFVDMELTEDYPHSIDSIGAEDYGNWNGVWQHYAYLYGLHYGCSR